MEGFNFLSRKNIIISLAAFLVFAMAYMAMQTSKREKVNAPLTFEDEIQKIESQSDSDSLDSIEQDLSDTELQNLDSELQQIEMELNSSN